MVESSDVVKKVRDSFIEDRFLNLSTGKDSRLDFILSHVISFLETKPVRVYESRYYEADVGEDGLCLYLPENWDLKIVKGIILHEFFHIFLNHFSLIREFRINPIIANIGFDLFINSLIEALDPKGVLWELPETALKGEDFPFLSLPVHKFYNEVELCRIIGEKAEKDPSFRKELTRIVKNKEHEYLIYKKKRVKVFLPSSGQKGRGELLGEEDDFVKIEKIRNINWDLILAKRIHSLECSILSKRNFKRENRKRLYLKHYIGDAFYPSKKKERKLLLFFVIDTSSSMDSLSLAKAKELVLSLVTTKSNWTIVEVHHNIFVKGAYLHEKGRVYEAEIVGNRVIKKREVKKVEAFSTVMGRGGTSHTDVFRTLAPFISRGEFIFVTDGMSNLDTTFKEFPFFKNALFFAPDTAGVYYIRKAGAKNVYFIDSHTVRYAV